VTSGTELAPLVVRRFSRELNGEAPGIRRIDSGNGTHQGNGKQAGNPVVGSPPRGLDPYGSIASDGGGLRGPGVSEAGNDSAHGGHDTRSNPVCGILDGKGSPGMTLPPGFGAGLVDHRQVRRVTPPDEPSMSDFLRHS